MSQTVEVLKQNLGPSVKRWRLVNRVKQEALALDLGVSQSMISRWESGRTEPEGRERSRLVRIVLARPSTAADKALLELVSASADRVHLVCDLTHRLLAVSPARAREWHAPVSALKGTSLWSFASDGIQEAEHRLDAAGWFEPHAPDIVFQTERADFTAMTIPESRVKITRVPLSDGSYARLVRAVEVAAA
ncbi:helix-turn-helix protein [Roseibium hamelinense]|uniref:Helix-turn-helix protein n=1 Tax=Roseibium hamelinense TaxID=150831 RepID=A0A562TGV8_9HYPH|nr:helix-turn-helix transcriptional regulator [Roseibium hamelinense]MTI43090.1 XRE family transcriptional regulator [Roseibium hamelinense]TWI92563.1 helix-turn-helix protein [Roseibium hamelinense]